MNWIDHLLLATITLSCVSCSNVDSENIKPRQAQDRESVREDLQIKKHQDQLAQIRAQYTPVTQSSEEIAETQRRSKAYYMGLIVSIKGLDDGVSSAESIARAAVSENVELLRAWKRAQLANESRTSPQLARMVDDALAGIPRDTHFDEATSIVLRLRRGSL